MGRFGVLVLVVALVVPAAASAHPPRPPKWKPVPTGSPQQYRGLDAVSARVAWVGGSAGEVRRTVDGGRTWQDVSPPDSKGLLFRDVEAQDAWRASVLAIGEGDASRIYTTFNGGRTWETAFVNDDPAAFYDCMDFYAGGKRGLALSDPVDGKFRIAATDDWGRTWHVLPNTGMPEAVAGEFAFAASGTCLVTSGHDAWFATGGGAARVFHSRDGGAHVDRRGRADPRRRGRRRVLARVPQPPRGRDGRRRLHRPHQRRPTPRASAATAARRGRRAATSPATARASTGSPSPPRR